MANQTAKNFDIRNGRDAVQLNGWLVFSNGAMREVNPMGALIDPPEDKYERAKIQVRYREALYRKAVDDFNTLRQALIANAEFGSAKEAVAQLKDARKIVKQRQIALKQARDRMEAATPEALRDAERADAQNRDETEAYLSAINEIKI